MGCLKLTYQTNLKPVYRVREKEVTREEKESRQNLWETVDTGNYYYGARYYDPKTSIWLSVDPFDYKSPCKTPYTFVSNNPIGRLDPKGLTDYEVDKETGKITMVEGTETESGMDRLVIGKARYNKSGDLKNKKVYDVDKETMSTLSGGTEPGELQSLEFEDTDLAYQIFESLAWNTKSTEWGYAKYQDSDGSEAALLMTSHEKRRISNSTERLMELTNDNMLLKYVHNHGNPDAGMYGTMGPSPEDIDVVKFLKGYNPSNLSQAKFFIWRYGHSTPYDETYNPYK